MVIIVMACNRQGTSVKVSKNRDRYELVAAYPNRKTEKLEKYLAAVLGDGDSILHHGQINTGKEIRLANGAVFYLRYNPGKLEMEMLLQKNSIIGRTYFDEMSRSIQDVLK